MPTNKPFPKENKKYIMEKSDNVRLFRKPGLFVPIKIEIRKDLKSRSKPRIKSEMLKIKFSEKIEKNLRKDPKIKRKKWQKKKISPKNIFLHVYLHQNFFR